MNTSLSNKNFFFRNWKWLIAIFFITICIYLFFDISQNAPLRYGAVIAQPELVENARLITNKNTKVGEKFGTLRSHQFLDLINGEVIPSKNYQKIGVSIKLKGDKQHGILDVWAHKVNKEWGYDSIFVRSKKPEKLRITVLKKIERSQ